MQTKPRAASHTGPMPRLAPELRDEAHLVPKSEGTWCDPAYGCVDWYQFQSRDEKSPPVAAPK